MVRPPGPKSDVCHGSTIWSFVNHAAEQQLDRRKRQCQYEADKNQHHGARRDHRLGLALDDGRRLDLDEADPAHDNGGRWRFDISPAIWRWRPHSLVIRQHRRHRVMPFGLIHFSPNLMHLVFSLNVPELMVSARRCRVPAMILAAPMDVNRTKMLAHFGPAQAGHRSFRWCCCHQHQQHYNHRDRHRVAPSCIGYRRRLRRGTACGNVHKLTICKLSTVLKDNVLVPLTMISARNVRPKTRQFTHRWNICLVLGSVGPSDGMPVNGIRSREAACLPHSNQLWGF